MHNIKIYNFTTKTLKLQLQHVSASLCHLRGALHIDYVCMRRRLGEDNLILGSDVIRWFEGSNRNMC